MKIGITAKPGHLTVTASPVVVNVRIVPKHLIPMNKFSSLDKYVRVYCKVRLFIDKLKAKIGLNVVNTISHRNDTLVHLIKCEQEVYYSNILDYFWDSSKFEMPALVSQLNVFIDTEGILRVGSKLSRRGYSTKRICPVLLPNKSDLSKLIIESVHSNFNHSRGCIHVWLL